MRTFLAFIAFAVTAHAQLIIGLTGGNDLSVGPGTAAFSFAATAPITLRSFGVYDSDPLTPGLYNAHTIGLWDSVSHNLLASATVPAQGAAAIGQFWYVALDASVTLLSGHSYVLGATYLDSDFDFARGNVTSVVTDPRITLGDALLSTGTGFEYPDLNVSGANAGFFGANALETAVPELSITGVFSAICLGGFVAWRRFRQVRAVVFGVILGLVVAFSARAEQPVTIRSILDARPADRQRLFTKLAKQRPVAYETVTPAVNRPPETPGNEHGQRPVVPPGIVRKYASP